MLGSYLWTMAAIGSVHCPDPPAEPRVRRSRTIVRYSRVSTSPSSSRRENLVPTLHRGRVVSAMQSAFTLSLPWCGVRESNPHREDGNLASCRWTNTAYRTWDSNPPEPLCKSGDLPEI